MKPGLYINVEDALNTVRKLVSEDQNLSEDIEFQLVNHASMYVTDAGNIVRMKES